ncbi:unnamed protein product, partial [Candidula unifasciata]
CQPPSIKKQSSVDTLYFIENTEVQIPCIAKGSGELSYTWYKNGEVLDINNPAFLERAAVGPGTGTLNIKTVVEDEGIYQCSVTNECGTSLSMKVFLATAKMPPFPHLNKPTEIKRVLGAYVKLDCKPPESVPRAKITWILKDSAQRNGVDETDASTNSVPLDSRVTMDYEGNLYITSLRREDEQGGKIYVCQAENLFTRSTNIGEDKKITVQGSTASDRGVDLLWHSGNETLVLVGRRARMKCIFSGYPEPIISWSRLTGGELERNRMTFDGNELVINEVQSKDAGQYQCTGRQRDSKSHVFTLTVEAAPQWKSQPRDVTAGVEESASFECDATGLPEPTVSWFINGKPYDELPPNPNRVLKDSTLTFTNLERDDSQVIQCNASNIHGSIWADVFLAVEALAPSFKQTPPEKLVIAENHTLVIPCHVLGKPKPRVVWYKGSQPLVHDRYRIQEHGDLLIEQSEKKDTGTYKCTAENRFGSITAEGEVMVRERTRIESQPMDEKVNYMNTVTFSCMARTDPMELENLRFRWLKNGQELQPSDRVTIQGGELTIAETNSKDTANYTCVAENGLDNDTATAALEVKAVPDPPLNVTLEECLAKQASIKWIFEDKMRNFDTMTKFIVEYMTEYKPGVWITATSLPYPALMAKVNLSPYAKYKFRVKAVNKMGMSEPSEPTSVWCETPVSVPDQNPDNVHTDESSTGFLVVRWKPMEELDLNGPKFRYEIEVQEQGTEFQQTHVVDDFRLSEKRIPVDNIYRPYLIKVRAVNQIGKAMSNPLTVTGYSGEAPPIVVPENFELDPDVNVTVTSAGFRWDPVDTHGDLIRGEFSGYKIRYWKAGERDTTLREHIVQASSADGQRGRRDVGEDNKVRGAVINLPSYADVEADVVVINKNFESNGSNVVNFSTPEGVPGEVEYLEALYRGSHHFLIQWQKPKEQNGIITGYQVSYRKINRIDFGPEVIAFDDLDPENDRVTLKDMEPDTQYRIFIRAKTAKGLGKDYFIDVRTISTVSFMALPVVKHVSPGENEANVTWEVVSKEKGSRHARFYYVEYRKKNTEKWIRSEEPIEDRSWGLVRHLEPGTHYEVQVLAMAQEKGDEFPSESFAFMTAGIGAARASFLTAAWFIGMMVAIAVLILILIIICIIKRNRGDNYPVQEKERLRGAYNDDNPDQFNGFGKGDENGVKGSNSFDRDVEKVPLDEDADSLDYGDDDASKFNEDGSFIGQYGRGEKPNEGTNASSIV